MDRARVAIFLALALSSCAHEEPAKIELVGRDCRIALPYVKTEIGECTPRSAAAYDFAFCHLHFLVGALAAPASDRARGESGVSAELRRKANTYGRVSQRLSDGAVFRRNVDLARRYYASLQKQNPVVAGSSLEYVRAKCDSLGKYHVNVLQELRGERL